MADSASAGEGCPGQQGTTLEDFKSLPNEKQSEEVFRLLSLLSPFASQVQQWSARFKKKAQHCTHAILQFNGPIC